MNVVFRIVGIVIVQDMRNVLNVFNGVSIQANTVKQNDPNDGRVKP